MTTQKVRHFRFEEHRGNHKLGPAKLQPRNFEQLFGIEGFSEKLLSNHFKLYEGYVTNTNTLLEELNNLLEKGKEATPQYAEMKRRLGWEFNGVRLHEYYFDNLRPHEKDSNSHDVRTLITRNFGSIELWKKDFIATGAMRGIGWVILYQDKPSKRMFNMWIDEHNVNHLAGGQPLLVMDVFEHAFMFDYGTDKEKYIEAFFKNINWPLVSQRCKSHNLE